VGYGLEIRRFANWGWNERETKEVFGHTNNYPPSSLNTNLPPDWIRSQKVRRKKEKRITARRETNFLGRLWADSFSNVDRGDRTT
jgi:hypothetical protein